MPRQKRIFIASSGKAKPLAKPLSIYLREELPDADIRDWWEQPTFTTSKATLDNLLVHAQECDFAIVLLTKDDFLEKDRQSAQTARGNSSNEIGSDGYAPRDNTIFELGMFMGALGGDRCFMLCSLDENSSLLPSDLKGIKYYKITPPADLLKAKSEDCRKCIIVAASWIVNTINQVSTLARGELAFITRAELAELEVSRELNGNLLLEQGAVAVVVNSVEPVEGRDRRLAKAVISNIREGARYEYFYGDFNNNILHTANLLQRLATAELEEKLPANQWPQFMKTHWADIWPILGLMQENLSIHFRRRPPLQFCVHNALSETEAICYLRHSKEDKFARWAEREFATPIAKELIDSCATREKEKPLCIFHSSVDFRLTEDATLDDAGNETIRKRRETILDLIRSRFPADLPPEDQTKLDKIWLEA